MRFSSPLMHMPYIPAQQTSSGTLQRAGNNRPNQTPHLSQPMTPTRIVHGNLDFYFSSEGDLVRFSRYTQAKQTRPAFWRSPLKSLRFKPAPGMEQRLELYASALQKNAQRLSFAANRWIDASDTTHIFAFHLERGKPQYAHLFRLPKGSPHQAIKLRELYNQDHPLYSSQYAKSISLGQAHAFDLRFTNNRGSLVLVEQSPPKSHLPDAPLSDIAMPLDTYERLDPDKVDMRKPNALYTHNTRFHFERPHFPMLRLPAHVTGLKLTLPKHLKSRELKGMHTQTAMLFSAISSGISMLGTYIVMEYLQTGKKVPHSKSHTHKTPLSHNT